MVTIASFSGNHRFLSNFYPSIIKMGGHVYDTVEHAYQAAKCVDEAQRLMIRDATTPSVAKKLGRNVVMGDDWEEAKIDVMRKLLTMKFKHEYLAKQLVDTGDAHLIEGNTWGDTFWGVCNGVGENHLGRLLMEVRCDIIANTNKYDNDTIALKRALKYESDLCEQLLLDRKYNQEALMKLKVLLLANDTESALSVVNSRLSERTF